MTDSKTREAFEAWAKPKNFDLRLRENGDYWNTDGNTQSFWLCWQAARRAALEEAAKAAETVGAQMISEAKENKFLTSAGRDAYTSAWAGAKNCAEAIRALADETQEAGPSTGAPPRRYKPNEDCS